MATFILDNNTKLSYYNSQVIVRKYIFEIIVCHLLKRIYYAMKEKYRPCCFKVTHK